MVTLRIDERTFAAWSQQASSKGLSVEDWLKTKTSAGEPLPTADAAGLNEIWRDRLLAFARRHHPTGTPLDDSRESIYE